MVPVLSVTLPPSFFTLHKWKKDITEFSNVSCDSIYKYFANIHYISFKNRRSLGGIFPILSYGDIFNFGSATALAYDQPLKLFKFLSSFSPLTSQLFCLFSFLNIHLSSSSAFIMQQVTSHIPLVNQFFSDLAGFSGFFSRSPKRTSVLDRVVAHRFPRASTVRWNFHIRAMNTVWAQRWHHPCFETVRGVWAYDCAGSWRVCEATGRWYFQLLPEIIPLHHASCGHSLQPAPEVDSVFVWGIMQQFTQFFWLQHTLLHTGSSRPPNYNGMTSLVEGVVWTSVDCEGLFIASCSFNLKWFHTSDFSLHLQAPCCT